MSGYKNNNYQRFTSKADARAFLSLNLLTPQLADDDLDTPGYYGPPVAAAHTHSLPTFSDVVRLSYVPVPSTLPTSTTALTRLHSDHHDCPSLDHADLICIFPRALRWRLHQLIDQ